MTSSEFKIESAENLALWFKYLSARSEREGNMWFKDTGAKLHYNKYKNTYDNVYKCLVNEGVDVKEFTTSYFKKSGTHSLRGLETVTELVCSNFFKSVRAYFKKTVDNVCDAMVRKNVDSSLQVVNVLCETGMLAPNFLSGKISIYWLAGVPKITDILKNVKYNRISRTVNGGRTFMHGDDFDSTFNRFVEQKDVYYHILCRAFDRMDKGVDSIAVTDKCFKKRKEN